jgi:malonyl-CoA/methylmalonyl-CoA synthetase
VPANAGQLDEDGIVRACKAELADFKVPKRVVFVDELPRNSMAKVQKNMLRERYGELFGGS